jgi:hypothetical protein
MMVEGMMVEISLMPLSLCDLVAQGMALGVQTNRENLLRSALADAGEQNENLRKPTPPGGERGPFYKRLAGTANMLREPGDPQAPPST